VSVDVTGLGEEIARHIRRQSFALKPDRELYVALKPALTKKEMKILLGRLYGVPKAEVQTRLKLDDARYEALFESLVKKLNSERVKASLYRTPDDAS